MPTCYIGIDIAKPSFTLAMAQPNGKFQDHLLPNTPLGFAQTASLMLPNAHLIMEASGPYYLPLATYLQQASYALSVVNPLVVRRFSQMRLRRAKTARRPGDKADARLLAEFGANQQPPGWEPPSLVMSQLAQLQTLLEQYIKQRTALHNQHESFTHSGVPNPGLEESLQKSLTHLNKQIQALEKQLDQLANTHYAELRSVPGVGAKTALCLLVLTRGFSRFESAKQLVSFVGLAPRLFESGRSVRGNPHLCKLGNSRIRQLLYMASMQAKKANGSCRLLYDRLVGSGKPKLVGLRAVAHKLVRQCFAVARPGVLYDEKLASGLAF